jgi:hypothetical protein
MYLSCTCGEYPRRHKPTDVTMDDLKAAAKGICRCCQTSPPDEPLMTQWRVTRALAGLELLLGP